MSAFFNPLALHAWFGYLRFMASESKLAPTGERVFATTHWSAVLAAGGSSSPTGRAALEQLCRAYWYPLYAYVRRCGYSPADAEDLTQGFFERLLEQDLLAGLRPTGVRFRSFLLHALKNHLASQWKRARAEKRGGTNPVLSLEALSPESRYAHEPIDTDSPDRLFERRWASAVLQRTFHKLQQEYVASGKEALFNALVPSLTGAAGSRPYAELALELETSEAALKMALHRLRKQYGELLRSEVAQTVVAPGEIDQELRHLLQTLAKN
jgi:RNA polymerase sigma-70 factor (ECF subfamily)